MNLYGYRYCYKARMYGDSNRTSFNKYIENGMLYKCTNKIFRIKIYACMPIYIVNFIYFIDRVIGKTKRIFKNI